MREQNEKQGYFMIVVAGSLWGIIGFFVKQMEYNGANAATISFLRIVFAFFIMLAFTVIRYGLKSLFVDKKTLVICALLGIICHGFYNICYNLAVTIAGVTVSAVLLDIAPVFTLTFSIVLYHEKVVPRKIIAIILNITGCVLTVTNGSVHYKQMALYGVVCGVGAGLCYSLTAIIGKYATDKTNPFTMSLYSYLFAMLFLIIFMKIWEQKTVINTEIIGWGFLYALIPTSIAYVIYYQGIQQVTERSKVPIFASIEVVFASIIGVVFYHENISIVSIVGIILVIGSIVIMNVKCNMKKS